MRRAVRAMFGSAIVIGAVLCASPARANFARLGTLALNADENGAYAPFVDAANGFVYFAANNEVTFPATPTGRVIRVRLSDFTRDASSLTFNTGEEVRCADFDPSAGMGYFGTDQPIGQVIKVRMSDLTRVDAAPFSFGAAGGAFSSGGEVKTINIDSASGAGYFGVDGDQLLKVQLSNFKVVVATVNLLGNEDIESAILDTTGGNLYLGLEAAPTGVVKIRLSDFTRTATLPISGGQINHPNPAVLDSANGFAYYGVSSAPGTVIKVRLSDFVIVATVTFNAGENSAHAVAIDTANGLAYFGAASVGSGPDAALNTLVKVRLSDFTRVGALALNAGEEIASSVLDAANGVLYLGTEAGVSPAAIIKIDVSPPVPLAAAPAGLAGGVLGTSSITWSWSALAGVTSYNFYPSSGGPAISVAGTSVTLTQLSTNTAYGGRVSALNDAGESPLSAAVSTFTLADAPDPSSFSSVAASSFTVAWNSNTNPSGTSYLLERWTAGGSTATATQTVTSKTYLGLLGGTTYFLRVSALNGAGAATVGATISTTTLPSTGSNPGSQILAFSAPAGPVTVTIPPGAFAPAAAFTASVPGSFAGGGGLLQGTGVGIELTADSGAQPAQTVTLTLAYRDSDVAGLNKANLILARYDTVQGAWVSLLSTSDPASNTVTALVRHFSIFQIMASAAAPDLSRVRVIPNPFRPAQGHVAMGFFNLPANARVRLYTYSGVLVKDLTASAVGLAIWDGTNQSGAEAASGVYFGFAQGASQSKTFKVVIQR